MRVAPYQTFLEKGDDILQEGQQIERIALFFVLRKGVIDRGL